MDLYGHLLLKSLKLKLDKDEEINKYLIYSALLHDIGKVSSNFQSYISSKKAENSNLADMPMDAESSRSKKF